MTTPADTGAEQRFLVLHDYGMGGLWWWVRARSARQILETFAEVEVVEDPDIVERVRTWDVDEIGIDAPSMPAALRDLRAKRDAQRSLPGFGALAGRDIVHLRHEWEEGHGDGDGDGDGRTIFLMEVESDGRRLRQVEVAEDGTATRSTPEDWPFNPPVVDLYAPETAGMTITREDFETAWRHAHPEDRDA